MNRQGLLFASLFDVRKCPYCYERTAGWTETMKRIHYLWKHPLKYVSLKNETAGTATKIQPAPAKKGDTGDKIQPETINPFQMADEILEEVHMEISNESTDFQLQTNGHQTELPEPCEDITTDAVNMDFQDQSVTESLTPATHIPQSFSDAASPGPEPMSQDSASASQVDDVSTHSMLLHKTIGLVESNNELGYRVIRMAFQKPECYEQLCVILEDISPSLQEAMVGSLKGHLFSVSSCQHGSLAVCQILQHLSGELRLQLAEDVKTRALDFAFDVFAYKVLIQLLKLTPSNQVAFLYAELTRDRDLRDVASRRYGFRVLQAALVHGGEDEISFLINYLLTHAAGLVSAVPANGAELLRFIFDHRPHSEQVELMESLQPVMCNILCSKESGVLFGSLPFRPQRLLSEALVNILQNEKKLKLLMENAFSRKLIRSVAESSSALLPFIQKCD